ncbi:MAG: hypothetical protein C0483_17220 [Pirellula sp.]|nr:hypothetical protein [Pirellula sp.]
MLPLDGRKIERLNDELQGRPSLAGKRTSFTYYPGVAALPAGSANVLNKPLSITADLEIGKEGNDGAISLLGLYGRDGHGKIREVTVDLK